jgi:beta-lactam-binding protein with PASTA domain
MQIVDSVFNPVAIPGAIIEQTPNANNRVKEGRTIYITVFAQNPRQVVIPDLVGYSRRYVVGRLNSMRFNQLTIDEVPSQHAGIVIAVEYRGRTLSGGEKIHEGAPLRLIVGGGAPSHFEQSEQNGTQESGIDHSFN